MTKDIFALKGTSYADVRQLVSFLVKHACRSFGAWDLEEDLMSQGMLAALEVLDSYDASRQTKVTSYIFLYVKGRINRYAYENIRYQNSEEELDENRMQTDNSKEVMGFEASPYRMRPDVLYDARRREYLIGKISRMHSTEIRQYVQASALRGDARTRQRAARCRIRCVRRIQDTVKRLLERKAMLSCTSEIMRTKENYRDVNQRTFAE